MIHKAHSISDMTVDYEVKGTTISVLTHIQKFEEDRARFPNDASAISTMALGKLGFFCTGLVISIIHLFLNYFRYPSSRELV